MAIKSPPILPDRKNLVQMTVDRKQLIGKITPKNELNIPRDPKGYTCVYNQSSGRYELTLAIIPMHGDSDYKQSGAEIKPIDMTSALDLEIMELRRR